MKKQFFSLTFLLICCFTLAGQEYAAKASSSSNSSGRRISVGVAVGPGFNWLQPKTPFYEKGKSSFSIHVGVPLDVNFTKANNYYFSTGLFFDYASGNLLYPDTSIINTRPMLAQIDRKYKAYYLTIPTGIKLKTPDFNNFVIAANFGMYHSFLLSSSNEDHVSIESFGDVDPSVITPDKTKPLWIREAVYAGLGLEYVIRGDFRSFIYVNFSHTFTNFFNGKKSINKYYNEKEVAKLNGIEFILGLNF